MAGQKTNTFIKAYRERKAYSSPFHTYSASIISKGINAILSMGTWLPFFETMYVSDNHRSWITMLRNTVVG